MTPAEALAYAKIWLENEGWHGSEFNYMAEGPMAQLILDMVARGRSESDDELGRLKRLISRVTVMLMEEKDR